jgi:hypothetical protein
MHSKSECGQDLGADPTWAIKQEYLLQHAAGRKEGGNWQNAAALWHRIVEAYSRLEVTDSDPSDRIAALGGLACKMAGWRSYAKDKGMKYCEGAWRDTVMDDLLWRVDTETKTTARKRKPTAVSQAPIWSTDSPVRYSYPLGKSPHLHARYTKVKNLQGGYLHNPAAGLIKLAHAVLAGPTLDGRVCDASVLYWRGGDWDRVAGTFFPDWVMDEGAASVLILRLGQDTSGSGKEYLLVLKEVQGVDAGDEGGELYERVGLHEMALNYGYNHMYWTDALKTEVTIV